MNSMELATADGLRPSPTERAAQRRLKTSGYEALRAIHCRFRSGTMHLTGVAPTYFHKQLAQEAVRTLEAVRAINNQITVKPLKGGHC
jgi:hypothetical protein